MSSEHLPQRMSQMRRMHQGMTGPMNHPHREGPLPRLLLAHPTVLGSNKVHHRHPGRGRSRTDSPQIALDALDGRRGQRRARRRQGRSPRPERWHRQQHQEIDRPPPDHIQTHPATQRVPNQHHSSPGRNRLQHDRGPRLGPRRLERRQLHGMRFQSVPRQHGAQRLPPGSRRSHPVYKQCGCVHVPVVSCSHPPRASYRSRSPLSSLRCVPGSSRKWRWRLGRPRSTRGFRPCGRALCRLREDPASAAGSHINPSNR